MAKPEWGSKRNCQACGAKFYDLNRDPAICPSCGTQFDAQSGQRGKRTRAAPAPKAPPPKPEAESEENLAIEEEDLDIVVDDEGDDVLVSTEDLDSADDDEKIPGVRVGGEEEESS